MILIAKKNSIYDYYDRFMCSISMTERAKELLEDDGWERKKESWLDYRQRTAYEREVEQQKREQLAIDICQAYNEKFNKS